MISLGYAASGTLNSDNDWSDGMAPHALGAKRIYTLHERYIIHTQIHRRTQAQWPRVNVLQHNLQEMKNSLLLNLIQVMIIHSIHLSVFHMLLNRKSIYCVFMLILLRSEVRKAIGQSKFPSINIIGIRNR